MSRFYRCEVCGNIIEFINKSGVTPVCCGQDMKPIVENTVDAALEKHVPVVLEKDNKVYVKVGEVAHPMSEEHYIQWIYLHTDRGIQRKKLHPGMNPEVVFAINENEIPLEVFEYCNLHGLWKKEI